MVFKFAQCWKPIDLLHSPYNHQINITARVFPPSSHRTMNQRNIDLLAEFVEGSGERRYDSTRFLNNPS